MGTARLVDSARSPAFRAIEQMANFNSTSSAIQGVHATALETTIRDLLEQSQASVFDGDDDGCTLLYVSNHSMLLIFYAIF
jgi:hypothetical protein